MGAAMFVPVPQLKCLREVAAVFMAVSGLHVPPSAREGVITIGNFDGVHRGHQAMLSRVRQIAEGLSRPAVVVTFDPHPITVLKPDICLPRLTTISTRTNLLKSFGADQVIVLPVGSGLLKMDPNQFFEQVIVGELQAKGIVEGEDFRYGRDRAGSIELLVQQCRRSQIELDVFPAVKQSDSLISSSRIRQSLTEGLVQEAVELLGHDYTISGKVVHGAGRGTGIGVPTANLAGIRELMPPAGVYSGYCTHGSKTYPVAINVGGNPTFSEEDSKVECHLVGFEGDLYDCTLEISVTDRLRDVCRFGNKAELVAQIRDDIASAEQRFHSDGR